MKKLDPEVFKQLQPVLGTKRSAILKAMDEAVSKRSIVLTPTNAPSIPAQAEHIKIQADLNSARGGLQNIFNRPGISLAISGEDHRYQRPEPVLRSPREVLQSNNVSVVLLNNPIVQSYMNNQPDVALSKKFREILLNPMSLKSHQQGWLADYIEGELDSVAPIDITARNKAHSDEQDWFNNSKLDQERGTQLKLLAQGGAQFPQADLVLLEKKLREFYPFNEADLYEEQLFPNLESLNAKKRSEIIAAYLFLSLADGDQSKQDRVLILIGENHKDIPDHLEEFVQKSTAITWVKNRLRAYLNIASHVISPEDNK